MFNHKDFWVTKGVLKWWEGPLANRGFCQECGSPVAFQYREAEHITIWVGSLDRPQDFQPEAHWGIESRLPWVNIHPELPDYRTEEYTEFLEAKSKSTRFGV
jgi:hypothetical protein